MSRGKFIPGGSRKDRDAPAPAKASAKGAAAPAEGDAKAEGSAPSGAAPAPAPSGKGGKGGKGSAPRGGSKTDPNMRMKLIGGGTVFLLALLYFGWIAPSQQAAADEQARIAAQQQADAAASKKAEDERLAKEAAEKQKQAELDALKAGPFVVQTTPEGAAVTIGTETKTSPATFEGIPSGEIEVKVQLAKFAPFTKKVKVEPKQAVTVPVVLQPLPGKLELASDTLGAEFALTGPDGFSKSDKLPLSLELKPGEYSVAFRHKLWSLPARKFVIESEGTVKEEAKFPYASITLNISPEGALVRDKTLSVVAGSLTGPFVAKDLRPGNTYEFVVEKFGFNREKVSFTPGEGEKVEKTIELVKNTDFETSFGMQMIWVPELKGWAGRYEVTQSQFLDIMGTNPSAYRAPNPGATPVDQVSFVQAMDFCTKATQMEAGKGKLPAGYRFALPTDKQFDILVADSDLDKAIMSRHRSYDHPMEVGSAPPNSLGLYDVLGNVNEWVSDSFEPGKPDPAKHDIGVVRGGSFLNSTTNFRSAAERIPWARFTKADADGKREPWKQASKYNGFRVLLVK